MKSSVNGFTAQAIALAAALGLSLSGPHRAQAAPANPVVQSESGPEITILSPSAEATFTGVKPVEISAFYQGNSTNQIVALELYVDGVKAAEKVLDAPETRGVVSFLVDASALTAGNHQIVVRATAADAEVTSAKTSFSFTIDQPQAQPPADTDAAPAVPTTGVDSATPAIGDSASGPKLSIDDPSRDGSVRGTVKIRVKASDASGKDPYVSLFIDRSWKSLRNYAPYEFDWDTTTTSNGYHTIEAFGYNDDQQVGQAAPMRVYVNNPGGRTERRTDLSDTPMTLSDAPAPKAIAKHAAKTAPALTDTVLPASTETKPVAAPSPAARVKAIGSRRPTRAALIASRADMSLVGVTHSLQMARMSALANESLALLRAPGLTSPFAEIELPRASEQPGQEMRVVQQAPLVSAHESVFTLAGSIAPSVQAHHVRILNFRLPDESLVSPFTARPILPVEPRRMTTVRSVTSGRELLVAVPSPSMSEKVFLHSPNLTRRYSWLRAAGQSEVVFNSSWLALQRPLSAQGSVLFGPLRQMFEADGGSLLWQGRTGVVVGRDKDRDMRLTIGRKSATINSAMVMLDKAPYVSRGRTMVPLSFIKAAMNVDVQYDPASGHLSITNKD